LEYVRRSRAAIRKEKEISEGLLLNILPAAVADELKTKGHADAHYFDDITILFSDFQGFTTISETMTPSQLVSEINICFKTFDDITTRYGIEKIKTIGDSYMAAGGLNQETSSTKSAILAALDMQEFIQARKAELDAQGLPSFGMRLGIHTGPVVAGVVGVKKFQYDLWGDTVNTASRMESHGEVGEINISEETWLRIKDDPTFVCTPRNKMYVKGKGEMSMYFVRRAA
jgi:class 3 adenylate cyclase